MTTIQARRLSVKELDVVAELNRGPAGQPYVSRFEEHLAWVARTLEQLATGESVAFGAFETEIGQPQWKWAENASAPIGTLILKRSLFSHHLEQKNLLICTKIKSFDTARALLGKAKEFAERHGFRRITTEIPSDDAEQIRQHIDINFKIEGSSAPLLGRKGTPIPLYRMSLDLEPAYVGDPFDLCSLASWFLRNQHGYSVEDEPRSLVIEYQHLFVLSFKIPSDLRREKPIRGITCSMLVVEEIINENAIIQELGKLRDDICMLFADDIPDALEEHCKTTRVRCIRRAEVHTLGVKAQPSIKQAIKRQAVRGILTYLGEKYVNAISFREDDVAFILRSGIGRYVWDEDSDDGDDRLVIFYSDQPGTARLPIVGYGHMREKPVNLPAETLFDSENRHISEKLLWSRAEYNYYMGQIFAKEKRRNTVCLAKLEDVTVFSKPIDGLALLVEEGTYITSLPEDFGDIYVGAHAVKTIVERVKAGEVQVFHPSQEGRKYALLAKELIHIVETVRDDSRALEAHSFIDRVQTCLAGFVKASEVPTYAQELFRTLKESFVRDILEKSVQSIQKSLQNRRFTQPEIDEAVRISAERILYMFEVYPDLDKDRDYAQWKDFCRRVLEQTSQ